MFSMIGLLAISIASAAQGQQIISENEKIRRNLRLAGPKLEGQISLDKPAYFPGEEIVVTVAFRNPEETELRVMNPFNVGIGSTYLIGKGFNPMQMVQSFSSPAGDLSPIGPDEAITFAPREVKTMTFDSSRPGGFATAPKDPGVFRLVFRYSYLAVEFEVREGALDSFVEVAAPLARSKGRRKGILEVEKKYAQKAFSIQDPSGFQLCVQINAMYSTAENREFHRLRALGSEVSTIMQYLGPFRCLETSPTRITGIDLSFGNDGTMLVIGKREGASMLSFRLNEANKRIP